MIRLAGSVQPAEVEAGSNVILRVYANDVLTGAAVTLLAAPLLSVQPPIGASTSGLAGTASTSDNSWYCLLDTIHSDAGLWSWTWTGQDPLTNSPTQTSGFFISRDGSGV